MLLLHGLASLIPSKATTAFYTKRLPFIGALEIPSNEKREDPRQSNLSYDQTLFRSIYVQVGAMDCSIFFSGNPDISGIGVRTSFYVQTTLLGEPVHRFTTRLAL